MLAVLEEKIRTGGLPNVTVRKVDPAAGQSLSGYYDLIVSSMTLHHVPDILQTFRDFYRVLNAGGRVALADLDSDDGQFHDDPTGVVHNGFDRENLSVMLAKAGFVEVATTTAATIVKQRSEGARGFTVFLLTGRKE
jgi:SAM-dependent methyltransferase